MKFKSWLEFGDEYCEQLERYYEHLAIQYLEKIPFFKMFRIYNESDSEEKIVVEFHTTLRYTLTFELEDGLELENKYDYYLEQLKEKRDMRGFINITLTQAEGSAIRDKFKAMQEVMEGRILLKEAIEKLSGNLHEREFYNTVKELAEPFEFAEELV